MQTRKNKRKRRSSIPNKQKKLITARLMEISLKLENHIYRSKPISKANAVTYMEEVCSYKDQCLKDIRYLQVIEKLRRSMKAILTETYEAEDKFHEVTTSKYDTYESNYNNIRASNMSPVYSLDENNEIETFNENFEKIIMINEEKLNDIETIDLISVEDDNSQNVMHISNNSIDTQHLSTSIITDNLIEMNTNNENCTQSIIFNNVENITNEETENSNVLEEQDETAITFITLENNPTSQSVHKNESIHVSELQKESAINNILNNEVAHYTDATKKTPTNLTCKTRKRDVESKKAIKQNKRNVNVKSKNINRKKAITNKTEVHDVVTTITNAKRAKNKKKTKVLNADTCIARVYNNSIENDLSWLENIRYVREIGSDENDPKLTYLNESFWNDYTLPEGWNNNDFM